ncbi:hypothetical protein Q4Q34_19095 [Flavivirga abyssicola]|uniref:hypothetical protein n=1 Tax=Flavivirga abyssicola TaxID=3063533 RepID=UPI0026E0497D|nr:hypothetical protein [Flavivirga sp. MEBiC07777]WVK13322.1 hypothetical protein Q4Q34_19095 [Flavivirga sp. MEBiC07777]
MARDIRELFKDDKIVHEKMPENHQERFLEKLEEEMPVASKSKFNWMRMAASVVLLIGLGFGAFKFLQPKEEKPIEVVATETDETKTLGDVSPGLKKVEDYYLASINLELSKMKYTSETKDLFDGYLLQLDELDKEYKRLSEELTESGPSELTVNALIDNLKFRLNLLYRLKDQLKELNTSSDITEEVEQSI